MATISLTQQMDTAISEMNSAPTPYYRRKYFKIALDLYNNHPSIQRAWEYIEHAYYIVDRFRRKAMVWVAPSKCIDLDDIVPFEKGTNQVYIVYFYGEDGQIIYSKPGTTTRFIKDRIKEELTAYRKSGVCSARLMRLWNCGEMPPEGLESILRAHCIKKYPGTFVKNDRFAGVCIDLDDADRLTRDYLGET